MPLSPADFYAYSRATGTEYPEDPQSRAVLAPEVAEWRRNQLKAPRQESDSSDTAGAAVLGATIGAGALAGAYGLSRGGRFGRLREAVAGAVRPKDRGATGGVTQVRLAREAAPAVERVAKQDPEVIKRATQDLSRLVESVEAPAATVAPSTGQFSTLFDYDRRALPYPGARERAWEQFARSLEAPPATVDFTKQYLGSKGYVEPTLTESERSLNVLKTDQFNNATQSSEDQMTGRMRQQLQRNQHLNLMQVDALEDVNQQVAPSSSDAPITQAAAQTADGIPVDQAEGISSQPTPAVKNFIIDQRRKVWDDMANDYDYDPIKYPAPTHARVEAELAKRLGPGAYKFGPTFSANRQAMEIYAMTGDPRVVAKEFGLSPVTFETFENMPEAKASVFESARPMSTEGYPSENLTPVIEKTGIKVNVPGAGEVDLADLRKPVITESTATSAEDFYQDQISKRKDWLTGVETDIAEKYKGINEIKRQEIVDQLEKVEIYLDQYVNQGNTKMANKMRARKQKLESQFENPDTYTSKDPAVYAEDNLLKARLRGAQNKAQEMLAETDDIKKYPTTIDWSGGTSRVFGEQDPLTGEFIPETMELRSDRRVLDTTPKGGGGRNVAEYTAGERIDEEIRNIQGGGRIRDYDLETGAATSPWEGDRTQTGREVDIYGVRLSGQKKADPEVRPSEPQYTKQEIANEAVRLSSAAEEGDVPLPPAYEDVIESLGSQPKTEAARRSVLMSESIRKAARQRAERNPMAGKIPQELEILRRTMPEVTATDYLGQAPRTRVAGLPPQQLTIPGVTGYGALQRKSPADIASEQLESYMKKRMVGRSTPLTSQAVIQPKLF